LLLVFVFLSYLSIPPYLTALLTALAPLSALRLARNLATPVAAAASALLFTLVISLPDAGLLQLRGFVVGFAMRLGMFYTLLSSGSAPGAETRNRAVR